MPQDWPAECPPDARGGSTSFPSSSRPSAAPFSWCASRPSSSEMSSTDAAWLWARLRAPVLSFVTCANGETAGKPGRDRRRVRDWRTHCDVDGGEDDDEGAADGEQRGRAVEEDLVEGHRVHDLLMWSVFKFQ